MQLPIMSPLGFVHVVEVEWSMRGMSMRAIRQGGSRRINRKSNRSYLVIYGGTFRLRWMPNSCSIHPSWVRSRRHPKLSRLFWKISRGRWVCGNEYLSLEMSTVECQLLAFHVSVSHVLCSSAYGGRDKRLDANDIYLTLGPTYVNPTFSLIESIFFSTQFLWTSWATPLLSFLAL